MFQSRVEMQNYSINVAFINILSQLLCLLELKSNIHIKVLPFIDYYILINRLFSKIIVKKHFQQDIISKKVLITYDSWYS